MPGYRYSNFAQPGVTNPSFSPVWAKLATTSQTLPHLNTEGGSGLRLVRRGEEIEI